MDGHRQTVVNQVKIPKFFHPIHLDNTVHLRWTTSLARAGKLKIGPIPICLSSMVKAKTSFLRKSLIPTMNIYIGRQYNINSIQVFVKIFHQYTYYFQGDSGGPLQAKSGISTCLHTVIGVTSYGRNCGYKGQPGIYTRVSFYVPWIERIVWP